MILRVLPVLRDTAVMNMALDATLLESALADQGVSLFRHYDWAEPAFTFGLSQSHATSRAVAGAGVALVRRVTGGGLVDHRDDFTYALLAPAGSPLSEMRATDSYRLVHESAARALARCGATARLAPCARPACGDGPSRKPGVCFSEPELHDVVRPDDGAKVAGAAQKRTRRGILFQGSVALSRCPGTDRGRFHEVFTEELAVATGAIREFSAMPATDAAVSERFRALFSDPGWNARR